MTGANTVDARAAELAWRQSSAIVRRTPMLRVEELDEPIGGQVVLKAENLQRTGSFKLRGALSKLAALGDAANQGVTAGSAGNHAQSVAFAATLCGVPCEVFMPQGAPVAKILAARRNGATVHVTGRSVDECVALAGDHAAERRMVLVHPFDDADVIVGQAGIGLELVEDVPAVGQVVIPVGGGGLAAGIGCVMRTHRPDVRLIGVQVEACPSYSVSRRAGTPTTVAAKRTIADGIAVKRPGGLPFAMLGELLDDCVTVSEDDVADAMAWLTDQVKLVVEGAGAVGVAAVRAGLLHAHRGRPTAIVVSGGNVDGSTLDAVIRRQQTRAGRRLRLFARIPDAPGGLATFLSAAAAADANVLAVEHVRDGVELFVGETGVELTLEVHDDAHACELFATLERRGHRAQAITATRCR